VHNAFTRAQPVHIQKQIPIPVHRNKTSRISSEIPGPVIRPTKDEVEEDDMEIANDVLEPPEPDLDSAGDGEEEVEAMIEFDASDYEEEAAAQPVESKPSHVWPDMYPELKEKYKRQIQAIRGKFEDEVDPLDTTMASEYAEEIFEYMGKLEVRRMSCCFHFRC
jgi:hypothetical protein